MTRAFAPLSPPLSSSRPLDLPDDSAVILSGVCVALRLTRSRDPRGGGGRALQLADFKYGSQPGPFELPQTAFKYAAILKDVAENIVHIYPACKLSTAAAAVGAWSGKWWGGNLKGVWLLVQQQYPDLMSFLTAGANAGGVNVMTYDLSKNENFHECPDAGDCPLAAQVKFYMDTYSAAGIPASVGFEIGTPAYPRL